MSLASVVQTLYRSFPYVMNENFTHTVVPSLPKKTFAR